MTAYQSSREDVAYSAGDMSRFEDSPCFLVSLDNWDISLILSSLRYAHWRKRWLDLGDKSWDEIQARVDGLERCLMSGCNVDALIEILQGALYYEGKGIAQIISEGGAAGANSVTLSEVVSNFDNDDILQYPLIYGILTVLNDILPSSFVEKYKISDPPQFMLNLLDGGVDAIISVVDAAFTGIQATAESGEAASDVANVAVGALDTVFSGMTAGALSLSAILDLIALYRSGNDPASDDNPALRASVRVLNEVFIDQGAVNVNCAPDVNISCGSSCGSVPDGGSDITSVLDSDDVAQDDPETDPPPDGFDTWEDFFNYKCSAANWLIDQYIGTLNNWATFEGVTGAISAIAVLSLLLVTVPAIGVYVCVAAIAAIAAADFSLFANFFSIATHLESVKEDIVCDLYASTSTEEASTIITSYVNDYIDTQEWLESTTNNFKAACAFLYNEATKVLFELDDRASGYEGDIDCSVCQEGVCTTPVISFGELNSGDWLVSGNASGTIYQSGEFTYYGIQAGFQPHPGCCPYVNISNLSGWTSHINLPNAFTLWNCAYAATVYTDNDTPWPDNTYTTGYWEIWSSTPFTVDFEVVYE